MGLRAYTTLCTAICAALCASARADELLLIDRLSGFRTAAHRGGYQFADSNTIARFQTALSQGADIVETDLQVSSDGVPFLFHDVDLHPSTTCTGKFSDRSARAIEGCNIVGLSHPPERFENALQWSRGRVVIDAEFKTPAAVQPAIDLVRRYSAYEWVYFQVGDGTELYERARSYDAYVALEADPQGKDAQLTLDHLLAVHDPRLVSLQLHPELATSANLDAIRDSGKLAAGDAFRFGTERRWSLWPFHRVADCTRVYRLGIEIAVSNVPESCAQQRDEARSTFLKITLAR
ncbi:MAG: glycerophosphodiester phosphodiesterase [Myxococcota bacterium]